MEKKKDRTEAYSECFATATAPSGGLPLVPCSKCHAKMTWAVSGSSKNRGREYYKCPKNNSMYSGGCDTFIWRDQYKRHLSMMVLVEQERREDCIVKLSSGKEVVFQVDHHVLDHLAAMNTSLDHINKSIRKSTAADEKFKMLVVALFCLLIGVCIGKISN